MEDTTQLNSPRNDEEDSVESLVPKKYAENLLQLEEPVEIPHDKKYHAHCHSCRVPGATPIPTGAPLIIPDAIGLFHPPKPGHEDDNLPAKEIEEVLLHIFPPTDTEGEAGKIMRIMVSQIKATDHDVTELSEALELLLKERHSRPDSICPIRRQLFTQCFNELIRQEVLNCPERGVILTRIFNEIRMTIGVYQTLIHAVEFYASSKVSLFTRKGDISEKHNNLLEEKAHLTLRLKELQNKNDDLDRRIAESSELRQKKHDDEILYLNTLNSQLKTALDKTVAPIQKKA